MTIELSVFLVSLSAFCVVWYLLRQAVSDEINRPD
jgi:hypothetical protein